MYPIIYIISVPRSRSTILFRALQAQNKFEAFHEPSQAVFNSKDDKSSCSLKFVKNAFTSYEEVRETVLNASKIKPVLVKEVSFACINCLDDMSYLSNHNIYFYILLRDPVETVLSLRKKMGDNMCIKKTIQKTEGFEGYSKQKTESVEGYINQNNGVVAEYMGYKELEQIHNMIKLYNPNGVQFITEEQFRLPYNLLKSILQPFGLQRNIKMQWEPLTKSELYSLWHEQKVYKDVVWWHGEAINSTCIKAVISLNKQKTVDLTDMIEILEIYNRIKKHMIKQTVDDITDNTDSINNISYTLDENCIVPCCGISSLFSLVALMTYCLR